MVLRRFSDETGGRAIHNTNDHAEHLDDVIEDASAYYLVGYAPSREMADGKFHKIDVEVKRRGVRVVARRGYYAPRVRRADGAGRDAGGDRGDGRADQPRRAEDRAHGRRLGGVHARRRIADRRHGDAGIRRRGWATTAAVRLDVERLRTDGTPDGPGAVDSAPRNRDDAGDGAASR